MRKITAQWIRHTHVFKKDEFECSTCRFKADRPYSTCPHCGAEMKGSNNDSLWVDEMELIDLMLEDK